MLADRVEPQVEVEITQQTPNPEAQPPLAVPDLLAHSEEVKHIPMVAGELLLAHSSLGKLTMLNNGNCSEDIIIGVLGSGWLE